MRHLPSFTLRIMTWLAACAITFVLHAGIYLAATRQDNFLPPPPPELTAAIMIDLAPIDMSAPSEVDNAADGPVANEQEAIQEAEPPPTETAAPAPPPPEALPDTPPPPPDVKPEAVLPPKPMPPPETPPEPIPDPPETPPEPPKQKVEAPKKVEKAPQKPKEKPKPRLKPADKNQVAAKQGGGPRSDKPKTADRSAAPTRGGSATVSASANMTWQSAMRRKIVRAKRFPPEARGREYGAALVSVTFGSSGAVTAARLLSSSGSAALDAEALAVMYRASPFPPPPGGQPQTLRIPMNFNRK